jgi:predicted RNase H-like nuclease (RuvC/YqgF family)
MTIFTRAGEKLPLEFTVPMALRDSMVVVSMDPGRRTAFVVLEVDGHEIQVIAWGRFLSQSPSTLDSTHSPFY